MQILVVQPHTKAAKAFRLDCIAKRVLPQSNSSLPRYLLRLAQPIISKDGLDKSLREPRRGMLINLENLTENI